MGGKNPYDEICEEWAAYRKKTQINKCIADFARRLEPKSSILDAGCGTGYPIDEFLISRGFKITGIDTSVKMIEKAISLNLKNSKYFVADLLNFNTNEKFDAVIAFDCLWHIESNKQKEIYGTVSALLKKGGYFIFTHGKNAGNVKGKMFGRFFDYSSLDAKDVKKLLTSSWFEILTFAENYKEKTSGERDLLVEARKLIV